MPWKVWKSEKDKQWYYHVTGDNNQILAHSEGYRYNSDALRAVKALQAQLLKDAAKQLENRTTPKGREQQIKDNQSKTSTRRR